MLDDCATPLHLCVEALELCNPLARVRPLLDLVAGNRLGMHICMCVYIYIYVCVCNPLAFSRCAAGSVKPFLTFGLSIGSGSWGPSQDCQMNLQPSHTVSHRTFGRLQPTCTLHHQLETWRLGIAPRLLDECGNPLALLCRAL